MRLATVQGRKTMSRRRQFVEKWKNDYDFKTVTGALGSLAVTVIFAFYNGFLGIYHRSLWHGSICVYYIVLVLLRVFIITARKRIGSKANPGNARDTAYVVSALFLFLLNLSLVVPVSLMVVLRKPVSMTLIPAIAMAAYTTYKIVMASVNLGKRKKSSDSLVRLLRTISFIEALAAILTLQNTLIMVNTSGDASEMLPLTAVSSAAVILAVLTLSVIAITKGVISIKRHKKKQK